MPKAQVIAPYEGRVAFTGLFRGYGRLLIIEHGAGYHTLLAGMGRIDVIVGQWLLGGEPVGIMDRSKTDKKGDNPSLYIELRRGGEPINPLPWLVGRGKQIEKSKVSG
jgi:septal ring factor EnvC (AmiA/AmiB activator)